MVSVISCPLLPPATSPELLMTWVRSWEPVACMVNTTSVIQLTAEGIKAETSFCFFPQQTNL